VAGGIKSINIPMIPSGIEPARNTSEKHRKFRFCGHCCKDVDVFHEFSTFITKNIFVYWK
jgi:hypothetical protein